MDEISRPYQDELLKALHNPSEAAAYLNAALESNSDKLFLLALQNVAQAQGIKFSSTGENLLETIVKVSNSMGLRFSIDNAA